MAGPLPSPHEMEMQRQYNEYMRLKMSQAHDARMQQTQMMGSLAGVLIGAGPSGPQYDDRYQNLPQQAPQQLDQPNYILLLEE